MSFRHLEPIAHHRERIVISRSFPCQVHRVAPRVTLADPVKLVGLVKRARLASLAECSTCFPEGGLGGSITGTAPPRSTREPPRNGSLDAPVARVRSTSFSNSPRGAHGPGATRGSSCRAVRIARSASMLSSAIRTPRRDDRRHVGGHPLEACRRPPPRRHAITFPGAG